MTLYLQAIADAYLGTDDLPDHAWVITRDYLMEDDEPRRDAIDNSDVGTMGPSGATPEALRLVETSGPHRTAFRMYDDDGELYYAGYYYGDPDSEDAFAPLDDFGRGNAGCTEIRYRQDDGSWETL